MPKYIIERDIPGVGQLNTRDKKAAALKSVRALNDIGTDIQWLHSYISDNKSHCVYLAKNEELIHEHARKSEFPVTRITEINYLLEPVTSEIKEPVA